MCLCVCVCVRLCACVCAFAFLCVCLFMCAYCRGVLLCTTIMLNDCPHSFKNVAKLNTIRFATTATTETKLFQIPSLWH